MQHLIVIFLAFAVLVATYAFVRERRLRVALQTLLQRLLARWRNHVPMSPDSSDDGAPGDEHRM